MTTFNAHHTRTIWSSIFQRKGGPSYDIKLFEDFAEITREAIVRQADLNEQELPVVGSRPAHPGWFLLTTERLLIFADERHHTIDNGTIIGARPTRFSRVDKTEMSSLDVMTVDGGVISLKLDPGRSFFGIWNILNNIVARNRTSE